jgi:hypothetical protein
LAAHPGNVTDRPTVLASASASQLRRLVDVNARVHDMSPSGWLVTRPLADSLHLEARSVVDLELLVGERRGDGRTGRR